MKIPLFYLLSPKDKKYIKIVLATEEIFDVPYKDVIKDNKEDCVAIKVRDTSGQHIKTIMIKKDDVKSQTIYLKSAYDSLKRPTARKN